MVFPPDSGAVGMYRVDKAAFVVRRPDASRPVMTLSRRYHRQTSCFYHARKLLPEVAGIDFPCKRARYSVDMAAGYPHFSQSAFHPASGKNAPEDSRHW